MPGSVWAAGKNRAKYNKTMSKLSQDSYSSGDYDMC